MWIQYPTDSTGSPITRRHAVTIDGERHTIEPTSTGAAQVTDDVGAWVVANTAVTRRDPDSTDAEQ
jgi:hypothetical protein